MTLEVRLEREPYRGGGGWSKRGDELRQLWGLPATLAIHIHIMHLIGKQMEGHCVLEPCTISNTNSKLKTGQYDNPLNKN